MIESRIFALGGPSPSDLYITRRIKERFHEWFEGFRHDNGGTASKIAYKISGTRNNAERAYLYFDNKVCGEVNKTLNEVYYGIRARNRAQVSYQTYPPQPKLVQFNDDITTVVWQDGSHTIVKRTRGDAYDEEKAIAMAVIKKLCCNNGCEMDRYFNKFFEHSADISNSKKKKGAKKK